MLRGQRGRQRRVPHAVPFPIPAGLQGRRRVRVGGGGRIEGDRIIDFGITGENVNRAMGPGAVTVAAIDFSWTSVPLVPVMVTVYDPAFVAPSLPVEV